MSVEEFLQKVAWLGVQHSPLGGGEASAAQEPQPDQEDDSSEATLTPPEPFIFQDDLVTVEGTQQASPVGTPTLDLNEEAMDQDPPPPQDQDH